jgi:hypothetical protein
MLTNLLQPISRRGLLVAAIGGAVSLAAIACGVDNGGAPAAGDNGDGATSTPPPSNSFQSGYDAARMSLEAKDAVLVRVSEERSGLFDNPFTITMVNGEQVDFYEFPSLADAEAASRTVSADGMTIAKNGDMAVAIDFLFKPHYFLQGNVIVVYTGGNDATVKLLRNAFGTEFAGDGSPIEPTQIDEPHYETVVTPAPIESVEVVEDYPGHFSLIVVSGLPSGCARFDSASVKQTGELELTLKVLNRVPAPDQMIACTEIYGFAKNTVKLGSADDNLDVCETYVVNWESYGEKSALKFLVTAPNVRCAKPDDSTGGPIVITPIISDMQALIFALEGKGLKIGQTGEKGSDMFGTTSQVVMVNGQRVEIFAFAPGSGALKAATTVSLDGFTITDGPGGPVMMISWIDQPNFYLAGNSIVLYVGTNAEVLDALAASTGQKFAGPDAKPVELPVEGNPGAIPGPDADTVLVPAPVVSVGEVAATKSLPPQYFVQVRTAQPMGCDKDAGWEVEVDGTDVHITVRNSQPANLAVVICPAIYGETEHTVDLGTFPFKSGVTYNLIVNGEKHGTFVGL